MFEVEAKIRITKGEYEALFEKLSAEAKFIGETRSDDTYYEKLKKGTIRIRKRRGKFSFDLKLKEVVSGVESNVEIEWELKNPEGWRKLLKKLKLFPCMRKTKKTQVFHKNGFRVELSEIRLLGFYLEIEKLVSHKKEILGAKKALIQEFENLGYSEKNFESKSYLELLKHV